jgi:hypothetical protein
MSPNRTRLVTAAAAALSMAAFAVPVSSASAATTTAAAPSLAGPGGIVATGWGGTPVAGLAFVAPVVGQVAAVIGPTIITTAPSTFINTNNQVSAGGVWNGGQVAP